jgi:hypothetical protein
MIIPYFVFHGTHQSQKLSDNQLVKRVPPILESCLIVASLFTLNPITLNCRLNTGLLSQKMNMGG